MNGSARKEAIAGFAFISPWIVGFIAFYAGPILAAFGLSFTEWTLLSPPEFVGLDNFARFAREPLGWKSLRQTVLYVAMQTPMRILVGFSIAYLLNQKVKFLGLWRSIYYFPSIISGVAVSLMWMWLFNPDFGLLNTMLGFIGIQGPGWIFSEEWALPSLVLVSAWGAGGSMIIYLAGLQQIPTSLYESADIDGASGFRKLFRITIPLMTPVILFNLVMSLIVGFQAFTEAFIMTNGGPNNATLLFALHLYNNGFRFSRMGYASALSLILFAVILLLSLVVIRSSSGWVHYQGGDEK